jgi:hypothetical protein
VRDGLCGRRLYLSLLISQQLRQLGDIDRDQPLGHMVVQITVQAADVPTGTPLPEPAAISNASSLTSLANTSSFWVTSTVRVSIIWCASSWLGRSASSAFLAGLFGLDDFYYLVLASRALIGPHIVAGAIGKDAD